MPVIYEPNVNLFNPNALSQLIVVEVASDLSDTSKTIHAFCRSRVSDHMFRDYALSTKTLKEGSLCIVTLGNTKLVDDWHSPITDLFSTVPRMHKMRIPTLAIDVLLPLVVFVPTELTGKIPPALVWASFDAKSNKSGCLATNEASAFAILKEMPCVASLGMASLAKRLQASGDGKLFILSTTAKAEAMRLLSELLEKLKHTAVIWSEPGSSNLNILAKGPVAKALRRTVKSSSGYLATLAGTLKEVDLEQVLVKRENTKNKNRKYLTRTDNSAPSADEILSQALAEPDRFDLDSE
jgi:hypothetical protein